MKQSSLGLGASTTRTRCRQFLDQMDGVVLSWSDLVAEIAPFMPEGRRGRPQFPVKSLLRIHFMQHWFTLSDPVMDEALHDFRLFRNFSEAGDQEALNRPGAKEDEQWHVAMRLLLDNTDPMEAPAERGERIKASIRAKVEHQFCVIKRLFDHVKVRYCGLSKNTAQLQSLFALVNLWTVRRRLTGSLA